MNNLSINLIFKVMKKNVLVILIALMATVCLQAHINTPTVHNQKEKVDARKANHQVYRSDNFRSLVFFEVFNDSLAFPNTFTRFYVYGTQEWVWAPWDNGCAYIRGR
jgi:hypothetical protein